MDMGLVNPWVGLGLDPNFSFCNGLGPAKKIDVQETYYDLCVLLF